jgi:Flp pilus assembly protein CpaB
LTSRRPFTLLGIVLALLVIAAFVLVAINASTGQGTAQQSVVVATRDLAPRIPIDASSLAMRTVPVAGFPASLFFHKIDDVKSAVPLVTIVTGEPITSNLIARADSSLATKNQYLPIPSGYVALTLPTSEQQGVAGYIQPDDYISIIATVSSAGKVASLTIFTNVHVIRVGALDTSAAGQGASTQIASSLTVVVTQCQADYLTWFLTYASLKYTLESFHDYGPGETKDPNCPNVNADKGVTLKQVQANYPGLF